MTRSTERSRGHRCDLARRLTAPKPKREDGAVFPVIEAALQTDGREAVRPVQGADDHELAFIYYHLLPGEMLISAPPLIVVECDTLYRILPENACFPVE